MTEEPKPALYNPEVFVTVKDGKDEVDISLAVPEGQEWLYAMLERQAKSLEAIKGWMTFLGILTIISIVLALFGK